MPSAKPALSIRGANVRELGRWLLRGLGGSRTGIVMLSTAIVVPMVASVVMGPVGDQVLAQDGYGKRDRENAGLVAALFGSAPSAERDADPRPLYTGWRERSAGHPRVIKTAWHSPLGKSLSDRAMGLIATTDLPLKGHAVCVRLCDGFYYPMGQVHDASDTDAQSALCASQCPGAPTRLFVTRGGADEMEGATAVGSGQAYDDLPMAFAHTKDVGPTCACRPATQVSAALLSPLKDFTLRSGDSVMTKAGWRVFQGADHWPYRRTDFATLRRATNLPAKTRSTLVRIEDASLGRRVAATGLRPLLVTPRLHLASSMPSNRVVDGAPVPRMRSVSVDRP